MDRQEVYERLKTEIQSVEWEAISPHFDRDAVFVCAPELDLADLGCLVAMDEVDQIKQMMAEAKLVKMNSETVEGYPADKKFLFIIVQPFVFVQEMHS